MPFSLSFVQKMGNITGEKIYHLKKPTAVVNSCMASLLLHAEIFSVQIFVIHLACNNNLCCFPWEPPLVEFAKNCWVTPYTSECH